MGRRREASCDPSKCFSALVKISPCGKLKTNKQTNKQNSAVCCIQEINFKYEESEGSPGSTSRKEPSSQCRRHERCGFDPWVGKIPWRRVWQVIPYSCLKNPHGQRSLVGYCPQSHKELAKTDTT